MGDLNNVPAGEELNTQSENTCLDEAMANSQIAVLDAIVAQAEKNAAEGNGEFTKEQLHKFNACEVRMDAEYPENQFLFSVDDVPVITVGDIHTIGAKQKGGKTSLVTILIAAILGGQWNRVKCLVQDMRVLYIDTEMKQVDTQHLGAKAAAMAGVEVSALNDRIHLVNFRPLTPAEMELGILYFIKKYRPQLVIIDGIVDLCANFNDVEASQELVLNYLMKTADEYGCAFINILHTNKTDGYTELRGHLGAFFEQKGVTVIKCEKDDDSNIVTVKFPTHRYAPVPEFHFSYDENGVPVNADVLFQEIEAKKLLTHEQQKAAEKEAVYQERSQIVIGILKAHGGSMERKALKDEAKIRLDRKDCVVKSLLKHMMEEEKPSIVQVENVIKLVNS